MISERCKNRHLSFIMLSFPERKEKIEDENRALVQQFQSQLTKQLDTLHKTIASSVTQQEQQLKGIEEDMQSFVSKKTEVHCISNIMK